MASRVWRPSGISFLRLFHQIGCPPVVVLGLIAAGHVDFGTGHFLLVQLVGLLKLLVRFLVVAKLKEHMTQPLPRGEVVGVQYQQRIQGRLREFPVFPSLRDGRDSRVRSDGKVRLPFFVSAKYFRCLSTHVHTGGLHP